MNVMTGFGWWSEAQALDGFSIYAGPGDVHIAATTVTTDCVEPIGGDYIYVGPVGDLLTFYTSPLSGFRHCVLRHIAKVWNTPVPPVAVPDGRAVEIKYIDLEL